MAENDDPKVIGVFHSYMTPSSYTQRATAAKTACDLKVPPAADSILGQCEYYYRPLHCEYREKVEKLPSFNELIEWAKNFDAWLDVKAHAQLLGKRDRLIQPECTDSDWSRHSNFMMRHIGCGHKPPSYYLSYGYYYCSNYGAKLKPELSERGKAWLAAARKKLQEYMEEGFRQNMRGDGITMASQKSGNGEFSMSDVKQYQLELDDKTFQTFAFNTHPLAYLDSGLADLARDDLLKIARQPSIQEWNDLRTSKQAGAVALVVIPKKTRERWDELTDAVTLALQRLMAK